MSRVPPSVIVAAILLAGPAAADVPLATTVSPPEAPAAQVMAEWRETVADLRDRPGFLAASIQQGPDGRCLALIRWDNAARLGRALSTLEADRRTAVAAAARYAVIAATRRWPGPPWMRRSGGLGKLPGHLGCPAAGCTGPSPGWRPWHWPAALP